MEIVVEDRARPPLWRAAVHNNCACLDKRLNGEDYHYRHYKSCVQGGAKSVRMRTWIGTGGEMWACESNAAQPVESVCPPYTSDAKATRSGASTRLMSAHMETSAYAKQTQGRKDQCTCSHLVRITYVPVKSKP
eukprot:4091234-Prymnesium_polylepis.3